MTSPRNGQSSIRAFRTAHVWPPILPPCSVGGTTLTIRKFQTRFFTADELVRIGTMPKDVLDQVRTAVEHNRNIPD